MPSQIQEKDCEFCKKSYPLERGSQLLAECWGWELRWDLRSWCEACPGAPASQHPSVALGPRMVQCCTWGCRCSLFVWLSPMSWFVHHWSHAAPSSSFFKMWNQQREKKEEKSKTTLFFMTLLWPLLTKSPGIHSDQLFD